MNMRDREDLASRLKRLAGQVAGIGRMLDQDRRPIDVATQVSAVRAGLARVTGILVTCHLEDMASQVLAAETPRERRELIDELVRVLDRRELGG